jgi:hypothetical protein
MKTSSLKPKSSRRLKSLHKKSTSGKSLKQFVSSLLRGERSHEDIELKDRASDWLFNKRANTSHPQKKIGRTNRVKGAAKK